jgi:hypothetical protein
MRDQYYRSLCEFSTDYDRVINFIKEHNSAAKRKNMYGSAEEFASEVVNSCIRAVVYGDTYCCSTGGAMAVRIGKETKKALLSVSGLILDPPPPIRQSEAAIIAHSDPV